jgi:hypothetical protein
MLRLSTDVQTQAADALFKALVTDEDGRAAVAILRPFAIQDRLSIGVEAIENGADVTSVNLAIKGAAATPVEVQQTQTEIEMAPEYIRRKLKLPWWQSVTVKVAVFTVCVTAGALVFAKRKRLTFPGSSTRG